ncbi:MAG: hypothetical protein JNJ88_05490 [Planctomycetes bacterium]|nr:hypothetical protein [Planctomycetota bacterium]
MTKPKVDLREGTTALAHEPIAKVRPAARNGLRPCTDVAPLALARDARKEIPISRVLQVSHRNIAIGAPPSCSQFIQNRSAEIVWLQP